MGCLQRSCVRIVWVHIHKPEHIYLCVCVGVRTRGHIKTGARIPHPCVRVCCGYGKRERGEWSSGEIDRERVCERDGDGAIQRYVEECVRRKWSKEREKTPYARVTNVCVCIPRYSLSVKQTNVGDGGGGGERKKTRRGDPGAEWIEISGSFIICSVCVCSTTMLLFYCFFFPYTLIYTYKHIFFIFSLFGIAAQHCRSTHTSI